jgi:hypothetical protein
MTDRRGFQKERPKMEKRKQRDERKETGRQQKGGYEKNAKERTSGNIQAQIRVYRVYRGQQSTMLLLQHVSTLYQTCFFRICLSLQWLMCVELHCLPKLEEINLVGLNFEWKLTKYLNLKIN